MVSSSFKGLASSSRHFGHCVDFINTSIIAVPLRFFGSTQGSLAVDKVVDKLCALVCWDNLINWLNTGSF
jgi:hypothetical protein